MPLIIPANTLSGGYEIGNSGLFNDGSTQALTRTHGASGSTRTFTFSCWVKFSDMKTGSSATDCCHGIFASEEESGHQFFISTDEGKLRIADYQDGSYNLHLITNRLFRDYSAWYHLCIIFDTTNGTEGDRCKVFINGVRETSFGTAVYPSVNTDLYGNGNQAHFIGRRGGSNTMYFDGYMADVNFIDGTAVACTEFGEVNDNGVWIPKKYEGSYGTNGFFLEFGNTGTGQGSGRFASDTSGQGNHYDTNNFSGQYQMTDSPTNNFCTYNPLDTGSGSTFSKGNLNTNTGDNINDIGTIGFQNGKWYWEVQCAGSGIVGVQHESVNHLNGTNLNDDVGSVAYSSHHGVIFHNNNSDSSPVSDTNGCIIGCAVDMDNNKIYWHKDGTYIDTSGGTQNPTTAANPITVATGTNTSGFWFPKLASGSSSQTYESNFGNPSFSISSGNADANGYGNFEYAVPSGFYALCTKNLAKYG